MFNKSELIIDRVRSLTTFDIENGDMLFRLSSLEDPSLKTSAEGEEVTDALGSVIATLYRAKKGSFSATNSLFSTDLVAAQFGAKKENGDEGSEINVPHYEILTIADGKVTLSKGKEVNKETVKMYAYAGGDIGKKYTAGVGATESTFLVGESGEITVPTGLTGKVYVWYTYKTANALRIANRASEFPSACRVEMNVFFKDKCNENVVYSGVVVCPKAKLNPEQVEIALTSTGKHPFEFTMMKDYCDETDDKLFEIYLAE